jgi:glutamate synthase (NADPH/NADH) large chain
MEHRGAESADNKTGDGAGVLLQIPHDYYRALVPGLPAPGAYGCGFVFFPQAAGGSDALTRAAEALLEKTAASCGLAVLALRDVPVDSAALGAIARAAEPRIRQVFLAPTGRPSAGEAAAGAPSDLDLALYVYRRAFEKAAAEDPTLRAAGARCYMPSLSSRTIVYKGMLMPTQLRHYYPELGDEALSTAVALVHSRFSTNTFPSWPLAQPFRFLAHNGEINTIKGNRFWMAAREALFAHPRLGPALRQIVPVIEGGASDSASFDNALELLVMAGRSLPHALMMLIPEAWNDKNPIPQELKDFYEYHACLMEPWDGPASMVFCDGRYVGGTLDRNGLRPSRYTVTRDGIIVMASETGVQDFAPEDAAYKGRLLPGKLLLVDLEEGRIIPDSEAKKAVYTKAPYAAWLKQELTTLSQELDQGLAEPADKTLEAEGRVLFMENAAGYTREDRERLLVPMALGTGEPTASMGTDTPLAVFSEKPQRVYAYFKQNFAQVTNPPIDSIREDLVMTLTSFAGPRPNLLSESPAHCRLVKVKHPIMTGADLEALKQVKPDVFKPRTLDAVFEGGLEKALDALVEEAARAVEGGAALVILSDRKALDPEGNHCAIPALLAVGAVHHGLIARGLRMRTALVVESSEPREIMHFALLFGYGADLVCPYGALASLASLCRGPEGERIGPYAEAAKHYLKGLEKALLKVMSKMGTSTLRSYRGAQIFEAIGLGPAVIEKCFKGTLSRIAGAGFAELEAEALAPRAAARSVWDYAGDSPGPLDRLLDGAGQYRWRKAGERHAWNPETIHLLQWATRTGDYAKFKQFTAASDALNRSPHVIRGLLEFRTPPPTPPPGGENGRILPAGEDGRFGDPPTTPPRGGDMALSSSTGGGAVPIEEVEPVEDIVKRFTTGAMSLGSLSKEAHETIARALNSLGARSNSGEGGEDDERFAPQPDGVTLSSAIKQVASGRFGVTSNYLAHARELQIKIAQGAKPGEGGQLPGHKVSAAIAKTRHSTPGVTLISPPPHHDIYSIEDLAELIFDLKNANPEARISVKLVSETGVGTVAAGVAKAHADTILISGFDGGTGASPQSSIRHAGLPWEIGLSETHQTLVRNGLRGRVRLQTDGQLKSGRDIVIAGLLGAEEFGFGTSALVVLGCVMMRKCHENTCPMGVATQDPELRRRFAGKSEYLVNFFRFLAQETREVMASLGFRRFDDLVGRADLLAARAPEGERLAARKAAGVDLSAVLALSEGPSWIPGGEARHCVQNQIHKIDAVLDRALITECLAALDHKAPRALRFPVKNTDRAVGAMLSYEVSRRFGSEGLPQNFITVDFTGSAGQSFGAFLAKGITFRLWGDANDYLGKGLSGGRLVLAPPEGSTFKSNENIITGNTALYGATTGELFAAGIAGERFCVRNSGARAVVEGTGDHCAEYMTGGRLVVLGPVGRNFGAGMSGGIAYVLDVTGKFEYFLNRGMVELSGLEDPEDERLVKHLIQKHVYWTGSAYAQGILDDWEERRGRFIKVLPVEYKRALEQMKIAELDKKLYEIRERQGIEGYA